VKCEIQVMINFKDLICVARNWTRQWVKEILVYMSHQSC